MRTCVRACAQIPTIVLNRNNKKYLIIDSNLYYMIPSIPRDLIGGVHAVSCKPSVSWNSRTEIGLDFILGPVITLHDRSWLVHITAGSRDYFLFDRI